MHKLNMHEAAAKAIEGLNAKRAQDGNTEIQDSATFVERRGADGIREILAKALRGNPHRGEPLSGEPLTTAEKHVVIYMGLELGCIRREELEDYLVYSLED